MPYHAMRSLRYQSILHILSDGRLLRNDSSILLLKNSLEGHPMLSSRRLFSTLYVSQHTEPPFFLFFSAWLLLMFLPFFNFRFTISSRTCGMQYYFLMSLKGIPNSFSNS